MIFLLITCGIRVPGEGILDVVFHIGAVFWGKEIQRKTIGVVFSELLYFLVGLNLGGFFIFFENALLWDFTV